MDEKSPLPQTDTQKIITLLEESNFYLKKLWDLKHKEHREVVIGRVFHIVVALLPWIAVVLLGYFVWQGIMHYLDVLNNNVNTLKSNFDALFEFFKKIIPDFSKFGDTLKQTWQNVQFWK